MRTPRERTSPKSVGTASYGLVPHADEWYAFAKRTKCLKDRFRKIRVQRRFVIFPRYKPPHCGLQDLRRGGRCPTSRIGQNLEKGGAARAAPPEYRTRATAHGEYSQESRPACA